MIFSLSLSSAILPPQTVYDEPSGITVTHVPPQSQPGIAPASGVPHLWITEIATDPDTRNKPTYDNAIWLHRAMDRRGNLAETDRTIDIGRKITTGTVVRLDEVEKEAYFDFYKQTSTNTSLIQVTFPNGLVKYYNVYFLEVP